MLTKSIAAERVKLLTTRSPYWCVGIVIVLGLGVAVLFGLVDANGSESFAPDDFLFGVTGFGVVILMIMAVLAVTSEFRFGTIRATFQAIPQRRNVLLGKAIVYGGLAAVLTFVLTLMAVAVGKSLSGSDFELLGSEVVRLYWGVPIYAFLSALIALGIGALIRQTAGAIVILLVWTFVLENLLAAIPKVREVIGPFLPFLNGNHFLDSDSAGGSVDFHWNEYGSLLYYMVFAGVVFAVAVVVTDRRDV